MAADAGRFRARLASASRLVSVGLVPARFPLDSAASSLCERPPSGATVPDAPGVVAHATPPRRTPGTTRRQPTALRQSATPHVVIVATPIRRVRVSRGLLQCSTAGAPTLSM